MHRNFQVIRSLEQDLSFDGWVGNREGVRGGLDFLVNWDPLNGFNFLDVVLILVILGLFFEKLVVCKRYDVTHWSAWIDRHPHEISVIGQLNLLIVFIKLNLSRVYQHGDMFAFQVLIVTCLNVYEQNFLCYVVRWAEKAQIEGARTEELRYLHVSGSDAIRMRDSRRLVKSQIATGSHTYVENLTVFLSTRNNVAQIDWTSWFFKCFSRMGFKVLLSCYCDCEVKIVLILSDVYWFFIVAFFDIWIQNGDFSPLCLVQTHLEKRVNCDNA